MLSFSIVITFQFSSYLIIRQPSNVNPVFKHIPFFIVQCRLYTITGLPILVITNVQICDIERKKKEKISVSLGRMQLIFFLFSFLSLSHTELIINSQICDVVEFNQV